MHEIYAAVAAAVGLKTSSSSSCIWRKILDKKWDFIIILHISYTLRYISYMVYV